MTYAAIPIVALILLVAIGAIIVSYISARLAALQQEHLQLQGRLSESDAKCEQYRTELHNITALESKVHFQEKIINEKIQAIQELARKNDQCMESIVQLNRQIASNEESLKRREVISKELYTSGHKAFTEAGGVLLESSAKKVKEVSDGFLEKWQKVSHSLHLLENRVNSHDSSMSKIFNAFSGTIGAGRHAELNLENRLMELGFTRDRDYFLQFHTTPGPDASRLIADCVIIIPNSPSKDLLIIDCKSSCKLFEDGAEKMLEGLERSLSTFASKSYEDAIKKEFSLRGEKIDNVYKIMYMPLDSMFKEIESKSASIQAKARHSNIFLAGPTMLDYFIYVAAKAVRNQKINHEYKDIIGEVEKLLMRFGNLYEHTRTVGESIQKSASAYQKLCSSYNARLLPGIKSMYRRIHHETSSALSRSLPQFSVIRETNRILEEQKEGGESVATIPDSKKEESE